MECMGCCVNAPMICVADYSNPPNFAYDFYEDLTPEIAVKIVAALAKGEKPAKGPQNGRQYSMPIGGRTSLFESHKVHSGETWIRNKRMGQDRLLFLKNSFYIPLVSNILLK